MGKNEEKTEALQGEASVKSEPKIKENGKNVESKTEILAEPLKLVLATLFKKDKEKTLVSPASVLERSYVETFNKTTSKGQFYEIDEEATKNLPQNK